MPGTSPGPVPGADRPRSHAAGGTWRLVLVLLAFVAATAGLARYAMSVAAPGPDGPLSTLAALRVDQVVELAVLASGTVAAAWVALSTSVALVYVLAERAGHHWRAGEILLERVAPAAIRRLVRSAVGVGVGTGLVLAPTAAFAADDVTGHHAGEPVSIAVESTTGVPVDLGWQVTTTTVDDETRADQTRADQTRADESDGRDALTDEVLANPRTDPPTAATPVVRNLRPATDDEGTTYVVLRGDTLWELAARAAGGQASDADVLREVTRWHSANREVIGADPDVILPGQVLHVPD